MICLFFALLVHGLNDPGIEPWGVDGDLICKPQVCEEIHPKRSVKVCQSMIHFYQNHISPIDGPRSSYLPSSSQYACDAISKYGVFKGIALGCDRLMRENGETWLYSITQTPDGERKIDPVR